MEEDPFTAPASRLDCTCGAMGAETYKFIETIISGCRSLKKDKKQVAKTCYAKHERIPTFIQIITVTSEDSQ